MVSLSSTVTWHPGVVLHYVVHEAGPDEAAATDDDDVGRFEGHKDWCHAT